MGIRVLAVGTAVLALGVIATGSGFATAATSAPSVRVSSTKTTGGSKPAAGSKTRAAAARSAPAAASSAARVQEGICTAPAESAALAAKLSADIQGALRGREGNHGLTVYDAVTGVSCYTGSTVHFNSASIVKTIILGALLRWHQETGQPLSAGEKNEATLMITESDNDAATALWNEVGLTRLQQFLDLAKMSETKLGADGYWGLTQVTAHDEMLLLELLARPNSVLTDSSRSYELGLMAKVITAQRWGTPAGVPAGVTVQVKNGWLPDTGGWDINSLGVFTGPDKDYMMAVLSDDNPSEDYGIDTIEDVARLVHRDLNAAKAG
jgi:beta-lactamase class A